MGGQVIAPLADVVCEYGFERDRIRPPGDGSHLDVRWWLFLDVPGGRLRGQRPRQGVVDRGFRFARGGRVVSEAAAGRMLEGAYEEAMREVEYWRGQPSHALGAGGELIPLDEVVPELAS